MVLAVMLLAAVLLAAELLAVVLLTAGLLAGRRGAAGDRAAGSAASGGAAVATIAALVAARCNASAAVHWQRCRQRCAGGAGGAKRAKACAFEDRVSTVVAGRALGGRALGWTPCI